MKRILVLLAICCLVTSMSMGAVVFVKSIDLGSIITPTSGIIPCHLAIDTSAATEILYVDTLNNGAAAQNVPAIKISDPLGITPVITTLDTNTGIGAGASATRGYGGVACDSSGNVYTAWTGNGADNSARLVRFNSAGTQTGEWLYAALNERCGGIDVSTINPNWVIAARFMNTSAAYGAFLQITSPSALTRTAPTTVASPTTGNPRDVDYDDVSGKLYFNVNGSVVCLVPGAGGDITQPTKYDSANGTYTSIAIMLTNSFAGHGVGVSNLGDLVGFTPNQNAGIGARTARLVWSNGTLAETLGTLDTMGNGTGALLKHATDVLVYNKTGEGNYIFVSDYDDAAAASRTFTRVAVYNTSTPVELSNFIVE